MQFYYYFYSTPGTATGYTRIGLRNESNFNNSFVRHVWGVAEGAVGFGEEHMDPAVFLFPNPANDLVHWTGAASGDVLVLRDIHGRTVLTVRSDGVLDTSPLAQGVYIASHLRNGVPLASGRLVIQR
jgi:hypothetical protein